MTTKKPETLTELLKTLERSGDLRSLARECGLSVRELRRRLSIWRRELVEDEEAQGSETVSAGESKANRERDPREDGATRLIALTAPDCIRHQRSGAVGEEVEH